MNAGIGVVADGCANCGRGVGGCVDGCGDDAAVSVLKMGCKNGGSNSMGGGCGVCTVGIGFWCRF